VSTITANGKNAGEEPALPAQELQQLFPELPMAHQQYASCIEACNDCADACDHCAAACLQEDDVKMMARCIALDMDCAQICRLAASYMSRGSEMAQQICALCADICERCCQECAAACRRCAQECRSMAGRATSSARQAVPA
jgi:hypothetical protein